MAILSKKAIIEDGLIVKALQDIRKEIDLLTASSKKLQETRKQSDKEATGANAKKAIDLTNQLDTATKNLTNTAKRKAELDIERLKLANKLKKANSDRIQKNAELKVQLLEQSKINKQLAKETLGLVGAYEKLTKKTNDAQKNFKNLAVQFGANSKQAKKARLEFEKLDNKLSRVNKAARDGRKDVGRYGTALKGVGKQLLVAGGVAGGVTAAVGAIVGVVKSGIKIFINFSKSSSKLASILGKTKDQISALTKQAKLLGSTTAFTASEVISLQTELAKLGFTTEQIEASTEGILNLAAATGQDLASSAELAGATLRIFNLDASEMGRVTDVLAKSTTLSSLSMEKLATIMPTVGKTAQLAGVSLEKTAALAGTLTDRGLDASSAATSLRNIFLELSKKGITWNEAMEKINNSTDKNKTSMDLFGKRAAAAGVILSETADSTDELTTSLEDSTGAANEMARVMLDNLAGDMTKAQSAWEGFILSLEDGSGVLSQILRGATQAFSNFLEQLKNLNEGRHNLSAVQKQHIGFGRAVDKVWTKMQHNIESFSKEEFKAHEAMKIRSGIQKKLIVLQDVLNKGIEKGADKKLLQKFQLRIDFQTELLKRTEKYIPVQKEENDNIAENTELTDTNTVSRGKSAAAIKKEKEELEKLNEERRRAKIATENKQITTLETRTTGGVQVTDTKTEEEKATELAQSINDNVAATNEQFRNDELAEEEAHQQAINDIKQSFFEASLNFANDIFATSQDEKLAQIEAQSEAEKEILKDQLDKGLISEAEFAKKTLELDKKTALASAKAEKRKALFQIAMDTATAIVKMLASGVPPFNFINAGLVAAQGAIQAAFVSAKPLPKFAKGEINIDGKSHAQGGKDVNIEGRESIINKMGTENAPLALDAINRGLLTDSNIVSGMSKTQSDGLKATLLMKGNDLLSQLVTASKNGVFQWETNGIRYTRYADGSNVNKEIIN